MVEVRKNKKMQIVWLDRLTIDRRDLVPQCPAVAVAGGSAAAQLSHICRSCTFGPPDGGQPPAFACILVPRSVFSPRLRPSTRPQCQPDGGLHGGYMSKTSHVCMISSWQPRPAHVSMTRISLCP